MVIKERVKYALSTARRQHMSLKLGSDHGRSILEQLQNRFRDRVDEEKGAKPFSPAPLSLKDIFERSRTHERKDSGKTGLQEKPEAGSIQAGGLNISFQFDLFYELSSKVEAKMGRQGANRFAELSGKVSETFMGNFSLSIDPVGSFMNGTEKSLEISPETTGEFFDAVEGLADLSPEALENFLKESDEFFNELEATYGEAGGAFDQIKGVMQEQAKAFFADVEQARADALGGGAATEALPAEGEAALPAANTDISALLPTTDKENGNGSLIEMFFKPEVKVSQSDYQDFLKDFVEYAEKFKQQMFEKLFNSRSSYDKTGKSEETEAAGKTNIVDTAV